jgi:DNA-binding transcriptional LysR family regulator
MTVLQIKCFLAMAGCNRYSQASEKLHLNKNIFFKCIKNLESELSADLFLKTSSGIRMTEAGQALYPHLQYILAQFNAMKEHADQFQPLPPVVIDIGSMYFSTYYNLLQILSDFQENNPGIKLRLNEYRAKELNDKLEQREFPCAFIYKEFLNKSYQRIFPLKKESVVAVMNAKTASKYPDTIRFEDMKRECFILMQGDSMIHHFLQTSCISAGFVPNELTLDLRLDTICELLKENNLVSLFFQSFAETLVSDDSLITLPIVNSKKLTLSFVITDALPSSECQKISAYLSTVHSDEVPHPAYE